MEKNELHINQLIAAYDVMYKNGDYNNARKVKGLYKKYCNEHKSISFVGHFSAGKSSFINALLDEDILPESPIPTSANIVQITSGQGNVQVFFNEKKPEEYSEPYDIDMIKDYCMKKGTISRIEISTSQQTIPEKWAFFDTPGIDAADDADRLITESSLHLVDLFVYVMDYNHVQSEANMDFLQHIQDIGIPFMVVINQIDKHNELELPFSYFQRKVEQTFDHWSVQPQHIFYTSMIDRDVLHNQFNKVRQTLFELMRSWDNANKTIERSFNQLIHEHSVFMQTEYEKKRAEIGEIPNVDKDTYESIKETIDKLNKKPEQVYESFQQTLQTSLENAYVMPADLRDKARLYLESQQSDFTVGILRSKKKTNEEKQRRTGDFLKDLNQSIQTTIEWKIRDKFQSLLTDKTIHNEHLVDITNNMALTYTKKDLEDQLKSGAKVNGNYVLRYTDDVASNIKQQFKANAQPFLDALYETMTTYIESELEDSEQEKERIGYALKQQAFLDELKEQYNEKQAEFKEINKPIDVTEEQRAFIEKEESVKNQSLKQSDETGSAFQNTSSDNVNAEKPKNTASISVNQTIESLNQTMEVIEPLPGFQSFINEMSRKQSSLENRSVTIALFGAFSAGKSSFANALLGENVLPSSPQPTTAVINRILPVSEKHGHGTVVVQYKDEATLVQDIQDILSDDSPDMDTLSELITWIDKNHIQETADLSDAYRSYLEAIISGYSSAEILLGQHINLSLAELDNYLTDESVSCFLEVVDVYYQCALTDQQVTLVDTPGADSVNRRHTNVAFNYIKQADAILYVTYYNHALSRADKLFLTQLGRVKDAFQLDKMFFIINAIDLAHHDQDLKLVQRYVKEQLVALGIRFPSIFPLSSKQALANKLDGSPPPQEMRQFKETFHEFIHHDLPALSIQSAIHDIRRAYKSVQTYLENIELSQQETDARLTAINNEQTAFHDLLEQQDTGVMEKQFVQKIEKQFYYVEERIGIGFNDLFKDAFNPATITESGKTGQKQLKKSLYNLLNDVSFELVQETQAVSLRVEAYIQSLLNDFYKEITHHTESISQTLILPQLEYTVFETPEFNSTLGELDIQLFNNVLSMYKGTRDFFVKNEKEAFKEALYEVLKPIIHNYVTTQQTTMVAAYQTQLIEAANTIKGQLVKEMEQHARNYRTMLTDKIDKDQIIHKKQELETILTQGGAV